MKQLVLLMLLSGCTSIPVTDISTICDHNGGIKRVSDYDQTITCRNGNFLYDYTGKRLEVPN